MYVEIKKNRYYNLLLIHSFVEEEPPIISKGSSPFPSSHHASYSIPTADCCTRAATTAATTTSAIITIIATATITAASVVNAGFYSISPVIFAMLALLPQLPPPLNAIVHCCCWKLMICSPPDGLPLLLPHVEHLNGGVNEHLLYAPTWTTDKEESCGARMTIF
jgi:hypothetical protein